jgi:GNAT superfamily N-acetyltransferase
MTHLRVIGSHKCAWDQDVANCGYITAPEAQGRGIARAMLSHSFERAAGRGFLAMQFNCVVSTNTRAVESWQRNGFAIVGRLPPGLSSSDSWLCRRFGHVPTTLTYDGKTFVLPSPDRRRKLCGDYGLGFPPISAAHEAAPVSLSVCNDLRWPERSMTDGWCEKDYFVFEIAAASEKIAQEFRCHRFMLSADIQGQPQCGDVFRG